MNYEKAYKEALERARELVGKRVGKNKDFYIEDYSYIFPELKESEDDMIREEIVDYLKKFIPHCDDDLVAKSKVWISWLEKQGERKPDDKVEPKFKVGDWVVYNRNEYSRGIMQIYDIRDGRYYFNDNVHFSWSIKECDEKSHLWTIQDAKDGDVLCCENGWTCIFKALNSDISFSSYCFMDSTEWFCETGSESHTLEKAFIKAYNGNIYPATKEQRDLLFQKMKEAGYEWDFEVKELNKIEKKPVCSEEDKDAFGAPEGMY